MVRTTNHVKHIIVDQSSQVKRLQIFQKNAKAVEGTKVATKKALDEANTRIATMEAKLSILSAKKNAANQALAQKKVGRANVELTLDKEKE